MATILIVDDIETNRDYLVTLLQYHGHTMLEAEDGRQALAVVLSQHPDLVITDVLMPVMDGYELVRQLRLDPSISQIPVVFYTAHYGEREAKALALSSGVSHVLTKPVESAEVLRVVARVLSRESEAGPPRDAPLSVEFDREHLRLLTDKVSEKVGDLYTANERLRALIDIVTELSSEGDADRRTESVCASARDLFDATYVTVGRLDPRDLTLRQFVVCGADRTQWILPGDTVPGILRRAVTERRPFCGNNPGGDPTRLELPAQHPKIQAFLVAPIASSAHVFGWICLAGNEGRTFSDEDEHLVTVLTGQVGRIYELEHEIQVRKQAELALPHERDRAQRYLDTAQVILLALDLEGRVTLVNRYACSILGRTADELIGRNWCDTCVPARIRGKVNDTFEKVLGGDLSLTENVILPKSGEERLIEWRNTVTRDDAGHISGTFSSGADITERHQAVEALRTTEERMRVALQNAEVGIWDMDYATDVIQWSETLEGQYGMAPGTFGSTYDAFIHAIHPDDQASVLETIGNASKTGEDFSTEHRTLWPDGTVRWLSNAGRIHLDEHGAPARGVGITMDITERHTLEDQYRQAQKMEAIGRLAGGVAHDFNNLLTVMLGYCELLLVDFDPEDPRQADIAEIQKAGLSAAGLTRQLLAFSRKQIIEPTLLDLNEVVSHLRDMLGRLIGDDIKVLVGRSAQLAPVKADRGQVEQIVMNLAVNARDAMPEGGTLTIETKDVELDEHYAKAHIFAKAGHYVALTVSDTGTGMTPQVKARLFEPFFTTKEVGRGTGLGLATVHGIITGIGGSVNVYSELGIGTSFNVYFPRADAGELVLESAGPASQRHAGTETVLVVDDSAGLRELARRLLQREGYTVLVAANADEAMREFEGNDSIDVLLTDVVMPGASGPELTRRLLERQPALKVIYMSGYNEEAIVHHGVLNPGIAFIHKPFTSATLGGKVREVLDK